MEGLCLDGVGCTRVMGVLTCVGMGSVLGDIKL